MGVIAGDSEIARTVFTIGHSTHELGRFVALLEGCGVRTLVDVRTVPKSRRMPHFGSDALAAELPHAGIAYRHLPQLGGFRRPLPGSPNGGWRNDSFRGYADHMATPEFADGRAQLEALAAETPTAMMCAEALWYRCNGRLVSDALTVRGWAVMHIGSEGRSARH